MGEAASQVEAEPDLGWSLGALLRSYRDTVSPALSDFPHGPRGYETMREVLSGQQHSQVGLANRLGIDRTVMTYLIDDLVDAGLVERRPNPRDRRQRLIVATRRGRTAVDDLCGTIKQAESSVLGSLAPDEQQQLRDLLGRAACATGVLAHDACEVVLDHEPRG